eukprot:Platyproteum_vivax@DN4892_c0_g1_i3.p1
MGYCNKCPYCLQTCCYYFYQFGRPNNRSWRNHCGSGKIGRTTGNGKFVVMEKGKDKKGDCIWKTVHKMSLPSSADFIDYSSVAIHGDQIAVTSQESAAVWVGSMKGVLHHSSIPKEDGVHYTENEMLLPMDVTTVAFTAGKVFHFPRNDQCEVIYCNVEGLAFLNENMFVAVSDKMKSGGRQPYRCLTKDQSVHVFHAPI